MRRASGKNPVQVASSLTTGSQSAVFCKLHLIARDRMLKAAYRVMGGGQGIAELNQVLAKNQATEAEQAPRLPGRGGQHCTAGAEVAGRKAEAKNVQRKARLKRDNSLKNLQLRWQQSER